ncbi:MAG: asparagine--tRNA ligase [Spirochaetaceae bacterium]|jgi:asparaginyl-tRNA synthetase|nr:asparagine--tRNA ligase [Spirochaetaceae bacterium]
MLIKDILKAEADSSEVRVSGWVRTKRDMKNLVFVEVNDGSCFAGIQCTFDKGQGLGAATETGLSRLTAGASVIISGRLVPSPASGQRLEIAATDLIVTGEADAESYPLQKKRHSLEFLREIAHLRARTNTFGAVARVRSRMAFAVNRFFEERGFFLIHTPIITANDAEGAGAMFQVTTLDLAALDGSSAQPDWSRDFFGRHCYLTVSGQLEAETYATALSRVYTFGPTFRAENSNTARHLAEFWMIEPEIAFAGLPELMALAEDFLKYLFTDTLEKSADELDFFDRHIQKGLVENLQNLVKSQFTHITYTDAVNELQKSGEDFDFRPVWGGDLQTEHEKYLTEKLAGGPVIVTDYPKDIKAFYMKLNDDDRTVRAMDVLVPRLGEIIGGSQREDDMKKLEKRMIDMGMNIKDYSWYMDLRRYGTVPHSGFGLGFERLIQYVSGMANIRDVIPYPRAAGQADF